MVNPGQCILFFKRKKFRLHPHQYSQIEIVYQSKRRKFEALAFVKNVMRKIAGATFTINPSIPKIKQIFPEILIFVFIALAAWTFLQSARLSAVVFDIKDKILINASGGTKFLQDAKNALAEQNLQTASERLSQALNNFKNSQYELENLGKSLFGLNQVLPQSRDAQKLLTASIDLAEAGKASIKFLKMLDGISFGSQGLRGQINFNDLALQLDEFDVRLKDAIKKIKSVNLNYLSADQKKFISENLGKLELTYNSVQTFKQLVVLGQTFFTGQKHVLLLLQNNNELRTTGGFIGSFGDINLTNGKIGKLKFASIYDLDGQLDEKILPPSPMLAVNDSWFLRDANWFASFDMTAKKIISFYEKEGGETPDLVIALTPTAVAGILKITGPLEIDANKKIDAENLVEELQILTQSSPGDPSNEPKRILSGLFAQLFQKIDVLSNEQKAYVFQELQKSLANKQILLYSEIQKAQKTFEEFNWAGNIMPSDRDYLMITSSNLGGTKTDLAIEQTIRLESLIKINGEIENTLTVIRTNKMPRLPNAQNKSFVRIFVPKGSKFIEATGFDTINLEKPQNLKDYKIDKDVFEWEKSSVRDTISGTLIGEESGKTFFGNWIILEGGQEREFSIKYILPFKLKSLDRLSLLVQKQPGALDAPFEYGLQPSGRILEWKNFLSTSTKTNPILIQSLLNKDQFFGMVLRKIE